MASLAPAFSFSFSSLRLQLNRSSVRFAPTRATSTLIARNFQSDHRSLHRESMATMMIHIRTTQRSFSVLKMNTKCFRAPSSVAFLSSASASSSASSSSPASSVSSFSYPFSGLFSFRSLPTTNGPSRFFSSLSPMPRVSVTRRNQQRSFSSDNRNNNNDYSSVVWHLAVFVLRNFAYYLPRILKLGLYDRHPYWFLIFAIPLALVVIVLLAYVEQAPVTGRLRLNFVGPRLESSLGDEAYQEIFTKEKQRVLPASHPTSQQVTRVAKDILAAAQQEGLSFPWPLEVHVIESNIENAFVLPNGKVFVYTGIIPMAETEAGLACLMGHELAHAVEHHAAERIGFFALAMIGFEFARGLRDANSQEMSWSSTLVASLVLFLAQLTIPAAYSRQLEKEADLVGLKLAALAGYDPQVGALMWKNMAKSKGMRMPEILSTHPSHESRLARMSELAETYSELYRESVVSRLQRHLPVPDSTKRLSHESTLPLRIIQLMDSELSEDGLDSAQLAAKSSTLLTPSIRSQLQELQSLKL